MRRILGIFSSCGFMGLTVYAAFIAGLHYGREFIVEVISFGTGIPSWSCDSFVDGMIAFITVMFIGLAIMSATPYTRMQRPNK